MSISMEEEAKVAVAAQFNIAWADISRLSHSQRSDVLFDDMLSVVQRHLWADVSDLLIAFRCALHGMHETREINEAVEAVRQ